MSQTFDPNFAAPKWSIVKNSLPIYFIHRAIPFFLVAIACLPKHALAQNYTETQDKAKLIYLYSFIKNIEWDAAATSDFKICLLKRDAFFSRAENTLSIKKKGERRIVVEEISAISKCFDCDLVFLNEDQSYNAFTSNPGCPSLFVTAGFFNKTISDIALLYSENTLRFSVNTELFQKKKFKMPISMTALADQKLIAP